MSLTPFYSTHGDLAFRETRTLLLPDGLGVPAGEYGLLEHYCTDRGCDCQRVLRASMAEIARQGAGVLVYLHENAPGAAHSRDNTGVIEVHGTRVLQHEVGIGAQILADLGLRRIRILINRPRKIVGLEAFGIEIAEQVKVAIDG